VLSNLDEDQHLETSLPFLAQYDALTKLPNHRQFRDRLNGAIARAVRNQQKVAVILLSVNHFKKMNAIFSYQTGDFVLELIADSIKQCIREGDTAARLGGDEFSVILEGLTQRDGAAVVAQRLLKVLSLPLVYDGQKIPFTVSIGIALFTDDAACLELLMQNAELALYHAKKSEANTYQFYTADMDDLHMRNRLRHDQIEQRFARLTPREREVMEMMITGDTSKMIAYRLGVSNRTIESHRAHIIDKMQADSLPDLIRMIFDLRK
jgi:diguanylate cyclase (GGDEF)-like protein